jgi:hypothetical protein
VGEPTANDPWWQAIRPRMLICEAIDRAMLRQSASAKVSA